MSGNIFDVLEETEKLQNMEEVDRDILNLENKDKELDDKIANNQKEITSTCEKLSEVFDNYDKEENKENE